MSKSECPSISVIVAVYKAENYIRRCLDSIRNQTFRDFEVLLIDDGSPDRSGEICEEYAAADPRFRVFHKENGGVATARQCGVDNALGEYIIHVDPDDWIELNMLERMYSKAMETDADIIICNALIESQTGQQPHTFCKDSITKFRLDLNKDFNYGYEFGTGLTNKLIRSDCYREVSFPASLRACEDSYVFVKMLSKGVSICTISDYLYHYDQFSNDNSLTGYNSPDRRFFQCRIHFMKAISEDNEINAALVNIEITKFAHTVFNYNLMSQREYTKVFFPFWKIILKAHVPLRRKFNVILSIFGLKWLLHYPYVSTKRIYLNIVHVYKQS